MLSNSKANFSSTCSQLWHSKMENKILLYKFLNQISFFTDYFWGTGSTYDWLEFVKNPELPEYKVGICARTLQESFYE